MNPIRKALVEKLRADDKLKELAPGGVHSKVAPQGTKPPYVIVGKMAETNLRTFDGPTLDKDVWMVKGVGDASVAEDIAARCRQILDNSTLDIEGRASLDVHRIGAIDFPENDEGERYDHVGHEYKIDSEEVEE